MTTDLKIPANYQAVMPYLILKNALNFFTFAEKVFDAKENHKAMRDEHTLMHGEIMIGDSTIMFAESTEDYKARPAGLFVYVANADETYKKALNAGATVITELSDQGYGRSGGVLDPFGNTWWITSVK